MRTRAFTHVAMSVAVGTLTPSFRADVLDFYSKLFGWQELSNVSTSDRLTIAVGRDAYINIREHEPPMVPGAYEHFGVSVRSAEEVHRLHTEVGALGSQRVRSRSQLMAIRHFGSSTCSRWPSRSSSSRRCRRAARWQNRVRTCRAINRHPGPASTRTPSTSNGAMQRVDPSIS